MMFLVGGSRLNFSTIRAATTAIFISVVVAACGGGGGGGGGGGTTGTTNFTVGGSVSGLTGTGLTLQDNAGDTLAVTANGTYTFATSLASGTTYAVTVKTQPTSPAQTCVVTNGSGTIVADVSTVAVACTTNTYTVGGTISGLTGTGLVLQDNAGNNLPATANGTFTFTTPVANGAAYAVTVATQPSAPSQTCVVTNGSGTVGAANVTNVSVSCTTITYTVGGSISGLAGTGLVLQDNAGNNLPATANGTFTFTTSVASGAAYAVTVLTQPSLPTQTCAVTNGSGTIGAANVANVSVSCTTNKYTVGGNVSGLAGTGLVLQDNGGDNLTVSANGSFTFATSIASGANYAATVKTPPTNPTQTCVVTNGSGPVVAANVSNISVVCTTKYTVGGTASGLTGTGLVLQNNAADSLPVSVNGSFTFATGLVNGAAYAVTVLTQPTNPAQFCTVTNGSGHIAAANVTNVAVSCVNVGKFVFIANTLDTTNGDVGNVSAYTITPNSGALTPVSGSPYAADQHPSGIAVDASGPYLYVTNKGSVDITGYNVDPSTGALTAINNFSTSSGSTPEAIAVAPSGLYAFSAGYGSVSGIGALDAFTISAGTLLHVTGSPYGAGDTPFAVAVDPASQFVFVTDLFHAQIRAFAIASGGTLTVVPGSPFSTGTSPYGVAVYPAGGYVYVANNGDGTVSAFSYNSSGILTSLGSASPVGSQPKGLAMDAGGKFLYVANYGDGTVSAFTINASSGALTSVGAAVATGNLNGVANPAPIDVKVDPSGQYVYVANYLDGSVSVFTVNASTGALTLSNTFAAGTGAAAVAVE